MGKKTKAEEIDVFDMYIIIHFIFSQMNFFLFALLGTIIILSSNSLLSLTTSLPSQTFPTLTQQVTSNSTKLFQSVVVLQSF